jgi:hypothetical protein
MKIIRNGEAWFSSLDEALEHARSEKAPLAPGASALGLVVASVHAGALLMVGWTVLQQVLRQR